MDHELQDRVSILIGHKKEFVLMKSYVIFTTKNQWENIKVLIPEDDIEETEKYVFVKPGNNAANIYVIYFEVIQKEKTMTDKHQQYMTLINSWIQHDNQYYNTDKIKNFIRATIHIDGMMDEINYYGSLWIPYDRNDDIDGIFVGWFMGYIYGYGYDEDADEDDIINNTFNSDLYTEKGYSGINYAAKRRRITAKNIEMILCLTDLGYDWNACPKRRTVVINGIAYKNWEENKNNKTHIQIYAENIWAIYEKNGFGATVEFALLFFCVITKNESLMEKMRGETSEEEREEMFKEMISPYIC